MVKEKEENAIFTDGVLRTHSNLLFGLLTSPFTFG
jgi:hypothetical protein